MTNVTWDEIQHEIRICNNSKSYGVHSVYPDRGFIIELWREELNDNWSVNLYRQPILGESDVCSEV